METDVTPSTCPSTKPAHRIGVTAALAVAALALIGTGCASDSKSSATTVAGASTANAPAASVPSGGDVSLSASAADASSTQAGDVALGDATPFGTALAITAAVTVQVADVRSAVNDLPALVGARGGAIFDSAISVGDPASATATVTVKVPPADLEGLIAGLGGLGELTGRIQHTEDVSEQLTDTANRIATAQKSVDRVRALLDTAVDLDAVVKIESELTVRETALEQLLATQRNVTDRVQLATLTITITPNPVVHHTASRSTSVGSAFGTGWRGFVRAVHGVAVALALLTPVIVLAGVGALGALVVRRIRRGRRVVAHAGAGQASGE